MPVEPPTSSTLAGAPGRLPRRNSIQLRRVGALLVLHGLGVDPPAVVGADERPVGLRVERGVLGRRKPGREEAEAAARADPEDRGVAVAVAPRDLDVAGRAAEVARGDRLGLSPVEVVAEPLDPLLAAGVNVRGVALTGAPTSASQLALPRGLHRRDAEPAQHERIVRQLVALLDVDHVLHVDELRRRVLVEVRDHDGAALDRRRDRGVVRAHAASEERCEEGASAEVVVDGDVGEVAEEVQRSGKSSCISSKTISESRSEAVSWFAAET